MCARVCVSNGAETHAYTKSEQVGEGHGLGFAHTPAKMLTLLFQLNPNLFWGAGQWNKASDLIQHIRRTGAEDDLSKGQQKYFAVVQKSLQAGKSKRWTTRRMPRAGSRKKSPSIGGQ